MGKPNVWISDLTHTALGISANTFPLGASYVYSYAKQQLGKDFDFKLFKLPNNLSAELNISLPDVMCFSAYSWNLELSYKFALLVKERNPNLVVVFGGPNFPTEDSEKLEFLKERPGIDFFVEFEGEFGVVDILKTINEFDFQVNLIKSQNKKMVNTTYIHRNQLITGEIKRIQDINVIPSPYLTGAMDKFFDLPLVPLIETTRGCPFTCSYCADGSAIKSRVYRYDFERTKKELDYIANRVKGCDELIFSDLNFGMYKQDLSTAYEIKRIQNDYKYPKRIGASSGKNLPKRITEVASIFKGWALGASIQSSDPEVLKSIKRENLSLDSYKKITVYLNSLEETKSDAEIILGLPNDTKEKHYNSLRFGIDNDVSTMRMFQAIMLIGTEMASKEYRNQYEFKTKYRIMAGTAGSYKIFDQQHPVAEVEEIIIGSNTFNEEDYLECRLMNLLVYTFWNNSTFGEVFEMLKAMDTSCFDCFIYMKSHPEIYSDKINEIIDKFIIETQELFSSWQEAQDFALPQETIAKYMKGELGTNELIVNRARLFNEYKDMVDLMFASVIGTLNEKGIYTSACDSYLTELKSFISMQKTDCLKDTDKVSTAFFKYEFDKIQSENFHVDPNSLSFSDSPIEFSFYHDDEQQEHISHQLSLYSHHAFPLGKLLDKSDLRMLFRKFRKTTSSDFSEQNK